MSRNWLAWPDLTVTFTILGRITRFGHSYDDQDEKGWAVSNVDMPDAVWHRSSFSTNGNCVEVARLAGSYTALRNSRDPDGPVLVFTEAEWNAFLQGLAVGEFD